MELRRNLDKLKQKQKGFTLVELIVVIAIIGILAGVMLPKYFGFTDNARESAAIADAKSIRTVAETYYASYGGWPFIQLGGTAAVKGTNSSAIAAPGTSKLIANTAFTGSTIESPVFHGTITGTTNTVLTSDGSFTYISNTGISVTCEAGGAVKVNP